MAHIQRRTLADGTTAHRVIWTDPAGNRHTRQFSKAQTSRPAEDARKFKTRIESELLRGTYVDPTEGQVSFRDYLAAYRASLHQRDSTLTRFDQIMALHVLPLIGDMRIGAVRRRDVQGMVNALTVKPVGGNTAGPARALAPGYVVNIYGITASVFRAAVLDQVIPVSPCVKIQLPRTDRAEVVIPTSQQVATAADRVPPRYRGLVLAGAGTGLRSGELRGLDLDRLRVLERSVRVDRQLLHPETGPTRGRHFYGPPKTAASYRTVPIATEWAEDVAEHLERFGTGVDGLVFTGRGGVPIRRKTLGEAVGPVLRELGLPERSGMHVFRHFYISGLIAGGEDILTVMRRAGHASTDETSGTYGHLWPDHETRTREASAASHPTRAPRRAGPGTVTRLDAR